MIHSRLIFAAFICGAFFLCSGEAFANQSRIALVIGNANYDKGSLKTPPADVKQLTQKLESVGFEVLSQENVSFYDLRVLIEEFGNIADEAELALFYYAGHAIRLKAVSYLIPVDVNLRSRGDLRKLTWLDEVINAGSRAKNFVGILDTCRNTRHAEGWGDKFGREPVCGGNDDIAISLPGNSIVAFVNSAVGETQVASSSAGASDYTNMLVSQIKPEIDVVTVLENTRKEVQLLSANQQNPVAYGQLEGKVAFLASESKPDDQALDPSNSTDSLAGAVDGGSALALASTAIVAEQVAVAPAVSSSARNSTTDNNLISEEDRVKVLKKLVAVKNAIAAGDKAQLLNLLPPSPARNLYVQLLDQYQTVDIELASSSSSRNAGQISGVLRINEMTLANGDKVLPASSYRDTTLSSSRLDSGEWSQLN